MGQSKRNLNGCAACAVAGSGRTISGMRCFALALLLCVPVACGDDNPCPEYVEVQTDPVTGEAVGYCGYMGESPRPVDCVSSCRDPSSDYRHVGTATGCRAANLTVGHVLCYDTPANCAAHCPVPSSP